jgi:hypothetical protein
MTHVLQLVRNHIYVYVQQVILVIDVKYTIVDVILIHVCVFGYYDK